MHKQIKIIAHRGNSSQAPENSKAAFNEAIKLQVDFLECDLQLSKDGVPILVHDSCFSRISGSKNFSKVDELVWDEIKFYDSGSWFDEKFTGEKVLKLREFLELPKGKIGMMLEVKEETFFECRLALIVGKVLKEFAHENGYHGPVLVGSLNPNVLLCFEGYLPQQQFIPILERREQLEDFINLHAKHYAIHYSIAKKTFIRKLHALGAEVWAWTVDDKGLAKRLADRGIDGIITNMPKKMKFLHHD